MSMPTSASPVARASLFFSLTLALCVSLLLTACGGGGGTPNAALAVSLPNAASGANVAVVNIRQLAGNTTSLTANTPYVSVKVCDVAGNCQTIPDVMVDTGSAGLRLFANKLGLNLPAISAGSGAGALAACAQFASGYAWGSMHLATVQIAGESTAQPIAVQLMNDPSLPAAPATCAAQGVDFAARFAPTANGILGISNFVHDCGTGCTAATPVDQRPAMYYACSGGTCSATAADLTQQGTNPIAAFPVDNNGSILSLPAVPVPGGASSATGTLTFGIGTQSNNALPAGAQIVPIDQDAYVDGLIDGVAGRGFIDSGSNGYFLDLQPSVPRCAPTADASWYCPSTPVSLTVQIAGTNTAQSIVIGNAQTMFNTGYTALPALGGTAAIANFADLGLPFFYGRPIATGLEGSNANAPYGYWAF